ncbi:cytochrome P450 6a2-like [Rhynchophorus ferrugineus]|uniref:cytochrome P450 6a2-like n=1 Tax=Rhynchophorus ferrugineus TaxID=354439 RepID=UPI003FCD66E9
MVVFILLLLVIAVFLYFKHAHGYWKRLGVPQLQPSFPFGDMKNPILRKQNMGDKIKEVYDHARSKNYDYIGLYFFSRKAFLPVNPELIKNILVKDFHHFSDRGIHYDEVNDPLSAHLFSIAGTKWKNLRAKLTPAYSPVKLNGMFNIVRCCAEEMVQLVSEESEKKADIEIKEILARYSTDVIGCCAFGLDCNTMRDPQAEFRLMGKRAFTQTVGDLLKMVVIRSFPSLARLLGFGVFPDNVTSFFRGVVKETIEYREKNNVERKDFMQLLVALKRNGSLEAGSNLNENESDLGKALTMDEAAAQAFIFFLAGFETTSTTTSYSLFEMAKNSAIQKRVRDEILTTLKKYDGKLTYDGLMELKYLDQVIGETLRKYPPAPVFLRVCTERYTVPGTKTTIEKGQTVLIPCLGLQRDPEYFPDPETFDPERFSDDNKGRIVDGTYIPFGAGPRNCIGMRFAMIQAKTALALYLLKFDFSLSGRTQLPLKMETKGIILAPVGGLWIQFKQRA